jgi:predicted histidine transporter YuiF (NhaC family)
MIVVSLTFMLKVFYIFLPQGDQMWFIKTIKKRVEHYPHIKLLFIFNLPIYVELLTTYVIDP